MITSSEATQQLKTIFADIIKMPVYFLKVKQAAYKAFLQGYMKGATIIVF